MNCSKKICCKATLLLRQMPKQLRKGRMQLGRFESAPGRGEFPAKHVASFIRRQHMVGGAYNAVPDTCCKRTTCVCCALRAPARLLAIDAAVARTTPGVVAVLTADDLKGIRDLPCDWAAPGMDVTPLHPVLARDRVRYVGEPVVAIAAETADAAEEALVRINVTYEKLPAVADQEAAMEEGAPLLHDAVPGNIAYRYRRTGGDIGRAFAEAEVTLRRRLTNNRVTAAPLEGRAVLSDFDIRTGLLTHHTSSQLPHAHARF